MDLFQFYAQVYPTAAQLCEQYNQRQRQNSISKEAVLVFHQLFFPAIRLTTAALPANGTDNTPGTPHANLDMGKVL